MPMLTVTYTYNLQNLLQIFPLPSETVYVNTAANARPLNTRVKSNLAQELEANNRKLRELRKAQIGDTTDEKELAKQERLLLQKKLTRDELFARRKELAYLKMRESQKSAKARMQNKIKSKKFHKLQKRQKMLEQMKEFELLQKTDPEAALEKLNALEKSRVQERASLRHKNTGTWAKNLQIRAKYDKDVRKDLAEQLAVSRELTQKKQESDSEDETTKKRVLPEEEDNDYDPFNPWTKEKLQSKRKMEMVKVMVPIGGNIGQKGIKAKSYWRSIVGIWKESRIMTSRRRKKLFGNH